MSIKQLWDEYRISKQFEGITGMMQDSATDGTLEAYMRPESREDNSIKNPHKKGKSVWIERVEIPAWFYHEVGYPRHA